MKLCLLSLWNYYPESSQTRESTCFKQRSYLSFWSYSVLFFEDAGEDKPNSECQGQQKIQEEWYYCGDTQRIFMSCMIRLCYIFPYPIMGGYKHWKSPQLVILQFILYTAYSAGTYEEKKKIVIIQIAAVIFLMPFPLSNDNFSCSLGCSKKLQKWFLFNTGMHSLSGFQTWYIWPNKKPNHLWTIESWNYSGWKKPGGVVGPTTFSKQSQLSDETRFDRTQFSLENL